MSEEDRLQAQFEAHELAKSYLDFSLMTPATAAIYALVVSLSKALKGYQPRQCRWNGPVSIFPGYNTR